MTAPHAVLVGDAPVGSGVELLGMLRVGSHVDDNALGQVEGHHHVVAKARDALVAHTRVIRGTHEGLHALQLVGGQALVGALRVEVDEHLVEAVAAAVLVPAALHAEADGHLGRRRLHVLGRRLTTLCHQVAVQAGTLFQILVVEDHVNHLLERHVTSLLAVECLE